MTMNFYDEKVLPGIIDLACGMKPAMALRQKLIPRATGRVLEVGMGSGHNLAYYNPERVEWVWGLEPSAGMRRRARKNLATSPVEVKLLDLPGEQIPLEDESVDTVVLTFTLCTIPDWQAALAQMHRVMKPGARLLFCEHGQAHNHGLQKWQDRVTPLWKKCMGGCHLNRPIRAYLEEGGFAINSLENFFIRGAPRFAGFMYFGDAVKPAR